MGNELKFSVNVSEISAQFGELRDQVEKALYDGVKGVASMTHAKLVELAQQELKSTRKPYLDALQSPNGFKEISPGIWVVSLNESALWIEEGRKCIVYRKQKNKIPKILTPDGERYITDIRKGDLVLNKYGKWTKVLEIYDEHIVEKSKYIINEIKACNYTPGNVKKNKREYLICFHLTCPICSFSKTIAKLNTKTKKKGLYCEKCLENQQVVKITISKKFNNKKNVLNKHPSVMYLTGDHEVMTQRGWVQASNLLSTDTLKMPSWSKCDWCNKPVEYGHKLCLGKEGPSVCCNRYFQDKLLKEGKHISQSPNWLSDVYLKALKNLKRVSGAEDAVAGLLSKNEYKVNFYRELKSTTDCIRQYPVKSSKDRLNRQKYFFMDFYFPKLNLGLEIDGAAFHCKERDDKRDKIIKDQLGCQIIRVPAKKVRRKDFYDKTLFPILQNHSNNIQYLDIVDFKLKKTFLHKYNSTNRRWDITVEDGESFVCGKFLIHNSGSMVDTMLKKNYKTSKEGHRYRSIPFEHSKESGLQTQTEADLVSQIRGHLKKQNIPFRGIEKDTQGNPKLGRVHSMDIPGKKLKQSHTTSPLSGLTIYQSKTPKGKVRRDILTFRTISDKHKGTDKWFHPGVKPKKLMDKSLAWAMDVWEKEILPGILGRF